MKFVRNHFLSTLSLGALLALIPLTQAQDTAKPEPKKEAPAAGTRQRRGPADQMDRIATELKLSDEQKAKFNPLYQEERKKLRELRQDTTLSAQEKRDKVRAARDEFNGKIKPILTPEQFDQFKKLEDQAAARAPRGDRPNRQAPPKNSGSSEKQ